MLQKLLNFLRGSVLVAVECSAPERIINLCAVHDIPFWDVTWRDGSHFALRTTRWGFVRLRAVSDQVAAKLTVRREKGAPVVLRRFRRRYVLLAAAALFCAAVWMGNTFIWGFTVTGNDTVPDEVILRALERQGVTIGTRALAINQEDLRNHILLELKDISWLAVNVSGCTAHVQVVERHRPPALHSDSDAANVIAARDGLVTKVEALDGRAMVQKGDTVTRGQLLISGVVDSPKSGVRLLHGLGRVEGRTWYTLTAAVPLTAEEYGEAEARLPRVALILGKHRINFPGKGSVLGPSCDKITSYHSVTLPFSFRLPVTVVTERTIDHAAHTAERTVAQARQEGEASLLRRLRQEMTEGGQVVSTAFSAREQNGYLLVTLRAECLEQIGRSVPVT